MQLSTLAKRDWLLLLAAAGLAYFYGLAAVPFVGPDEPRYAQVAREMFARGDLVTPTLAGFHWFEKPALTYWAVMAGFGSFGVSEWAARLGGAAAGWLTVLVVGWVGGRVERRGGGASRGLRLACGGAAASCAGIIVFARAVNFDIYLTATVALSLGCYFAAELESDARRRRLPLTGFYAGMGLALLAKGLVGVVLPLGVVALYALLTRRRPAALKSLPWGLPLAALVAAAWYGPVVARHGVEFVEEFFVRHHFARYTSNRYRHPQPFYFYLLIMPLLALPWTAFLAQALARAASGLTTLWPGRSTTLSEARLSHATGAAKESLANGDVISPGDEVSDGSGRLRLFGLAWLLVPIAFFSLSGSKLPGYVLPALPGAALLVGEGLARYARGAGGEWPMRATGGLLLLFAIACVGYAARTGAVSIACAGLVAAPLALAGVGCVLTLGARPGRAAQVVGAALLATMLAAGCAAEGIARRVSVGPLMRQADARGYADAPVLTLHTIERTAEFYAAGRLQYDGEGEPVKLEGAGQIVDFLKARGGAALVFVPLEFAGQVSADSPLEAQSLGDNGRVALYAVRLR